MRTGWGEDSVEQGEQRLVTLCTWEAPVCLLGVLNPATHTTGATRTWPSFLQVTAP